MMNLLRTLTILMVLCLLVSACRKKRAAAGAQEPTVTVAAPPAAAPETAGPTEAPTAAPVRERLAPEPLDLAKLNTKIREFTETYGRAPTTLQELVDKRFLPRVPQPPPGRQLRYDAKNFQVQLL